MSVAAAPPAARLGRVGLLAYALDRATGGIARYTRELRRALTDVGVSLTTLEAGRSARRSDGTVPLPGAGLLPGLMTLGQAEIGWAARRHRLALVHDPTGVSPLLLTPARRVATIHDVIPLIHPAASTTLDRLIYRYWLPTMARRLDAIITVSEHSRRDIVDRLRVDPTTVHVVPNAVGPSFGPVDRAHAEAVAERHGIAGPYLLYVGSVEARKNLDRLLQAYALLREQRAGRQRQLVIVGAPGWKASPVYATVDRLGLESCVRFTGRVPDDELPALYGGADLFVFPSLYEGYGLPVLEAMAAGTPVVTANASSLPEVGGDAVVYCDPQAPASIAEAMGTVLDNPGRARELAERGRSRANEFTWGRAARGTLAVYERALGVG